jgi:hypothetical protein
MDCDFAAAVDEALVEHGGADTVDNGSDKLETTSMV